MHTSLEDTTDAATDDEVVEEAMGNDAVLEDIDPQLLLPLSFFRRRLYTPIVLATLGMMGYCAVERPNIGNIAVVIGGSIAVARNIRGLRSDQREAMKMLTTAYEESPADIAKLLQNASRKHGYVRSGSRYAAGQLGVTLDESEMM